MSKLAHKVEKDLIKAIDKDDLVLPTLPEVALNIRKAAENPDISVSHLSKVIGRLGVNYSSNLAIGLVMEQIFNARSDVVEQKMREVWRQSLEVAGICYTLCRRYTQLKPDQAALGGLVHQIGVLPILTYAEDHNELLSDPISLNHVIDNIHPLVGDKLLAVWEFPEMLLKLPGQYLDLSRESKTLDYIDLVQIATVFTHQDNDISRAIELSTLPAFKKLKLDANSPKLMEELTAARGMFI